MSSATPNNPSERAADLTRFADVYARAANALADVCRAGTNDPVDAVPALFLLRHAVELQIKALAERLLDVHALYEGDRAALEGFRATHDLAVLWRDVRPLILAAGVSQLSSVREVRDSADDLITALHPLDPDAQQFRYPFRRDGTSTVPRIGELSVYEVINAACRTSDALVRLRGEVEWEKGLASEFRAFLQRLQERGEEAENGS